MDETGKPAVISFVLEKCKDSAKNDEVTFLRIFNNSASKGKEMTFEKCQFHSSK